MADNISIDDILTHPADKPITAQDIIDAVPEDRKPVKSYADSQGNAVDPASVAPTGIAAAQNLSVQQQPTGADQNVQNGSAGFAANFKAGFVDDPQTKINIISKAMFPNDPNAAQRFGVRDGKIVYVDNDLNLKHVDSGFTAGAGNALAYAPETAGAVIGSFAEGNPITGSATGAAGGKGIKKIIGATVFDEPQTMAGNARDIASEGAINLVGGVLAKGAGALLNKGRVVNFTPANAEAATATREAVKNQTGITLDLAQASQDPQLLSLRKYAAKFPGESAQIFKALDELQTTQSADAMQNLIAKVSSSMSSEASGRQGINAAMETIKAARAQVSKQVKPLYDAAYAAVPEITDDKILGYLKLPYFQQAYKAGQKIATLEDKAAGVTKQVTEKSSREQIRPGLYKTVTSQETTTAPKPDLRSLDYTKRALDDQIDSLMTAGKRQEARALKMKRDEFVASLDALPNQQWQAARKAYGDLAKSTIEPLENGAVGVLSRIKDPKAATAAAKLFSDPAITASEINAAKAAMTKVDPESWRALSGQYLAGVLDKSLKVSQKGETVNLAGKLYQALSGTPQQAAKLRAALPADAQAPLTEMLGALKLVAGTERAGSDTAFNQLVTQKLEGRFSKGLKWLRSPIETAIKTGEENSLDKTVASLARGLTNPAEIASLKQVSKYPPGVLRGLVMLSSITAVPGERAAEGLVSPMSDAPIPALEPQRGAYKRPPTQGSPSGR